MKEKKNEVKPYCIPNMPVIISLRRQPLRDAKRFDRDTLYYKQRHNQATS